MAKRTARFEFRCNPVLLEDIDRVRGDVPRARWVERALESALSEAQGLSGREQAGPGPVPSTEGVRPAAPSRTPVISEDFEPARKPTFMTRDQLAMERQRKLNESKS